MNLSPAMARDLFHRRLEQSLLAAFLLTVLLLCTAAILYGRQERHDRLATATEQAATLTRALEEHVRRSLDAVDAALGTMALDAAAGRAPEAIQRDLARKRALLPQVRWLAVFGPELDLQASSGDDDVLRMSTALRAALARRLADPDERLRVGQPLGSPQAPAIPVMRRMLGADGAVTGIAVAVLDTEHLERFYRELQLSAAQSLVLARDDGTLLLRHPHYASMPPGLDMSVLSPVFRQPRPLTGPVTLQAASMIDGVERLLTYREIGQPSLLVGIGQDLDPLLAPWRQRVLTLAFGVAGVVAALSVLLWVAMAQIRRSAEAERRHRETLEHKVRERTAELEHANEELRAFTYSASHDLRGPLHGIHGVMQLLRQKHGHTLPDPALEILHHAENSVANMVRLTEDLLTLSGVGRRALEPQPVDLSAMAYEIAAELADADPEYHVDLRVEAGMSVVGDPGLLRIALHNLLANAWKYSSRAEEPVVEVSSEVFNGERVFIVRDNGAGFDAAHAHRLFQPFQRLHSSREFPGTGVGLATVARVVRRHGGRVWADGAPGAGAAFSFTLPEPEDGTLAQPA
ncbi:sensor histidine kinase [Rubrivivax gelatinosus]|uniref:histidine kinase n=1 Tax=Rubrivivax gelatinosus TaxID=28068 RepID=A0A4R2M5S7_RUBGE|nr:ATP-binding protein [Rubrivivax gelatinosus]MBK1687184.1 two-component sensor histidine kinase [Rubrivivax gelatinosus]TCP02589.1 phospho-acceptor domain-containing protein [Rubrivivax gelatinosus]